MPIKPHSFVCAVLVILGFSIPSVHAAIIDFEDLPDAKFFSSGGQNIDTFYPGITFGPNVTGLSVSRFGGYSDSAFPPRSGDVVIWDPFDATITITFASALQSFGVWYTSFDPLTLEAFDAGTSLLGSALGSPNTDGSTGNPSFLSFGGPGIRSVSLTSTAGFFVLDDVTYQTATAIIPEPGSFLLVMSGLSLLLSRTVYRRVR